MNGCFFQPSFTAKLPLVFVITQENASFQSFYFKVNRKALGSSKNGTRYFQNSFPFLKDRHVFRWQSLEILSVFNTLSLKQVYWKTKIFFKKLEYLFYLESTVIENATFPYKTILSRANVKIGRIRSTKWIHRKV